MRLFDRMIEWAVPEGTIRNTWKMAMGRDVMGWWAEHTEEGRERMKEYGEMRRGHGEGVE